MQQGSLVALWRECWPIEIGVPDPRSAGGGKYLIMNRMPFRILFHCHPLIVPM